MVTQCTSCLVWFKVTREQLHAAHGLVRCSACGTVFNALATLRHDTPGTNKAPGTELPAVDDIGRGTAPAAPGKQKEQAPAPKSDETDGMEDMLWKVIEQQPLQSDAREDRLGEGAFEEDQPDAAGFDAEPAAVDRDADDLSPAPGGESEPEAGEALPPMLEPLATPSGRLRWLWATVLGLVLLALVVQIVYVRRASMAALFGISLGQTIALDQYAITGATLDAAPSQPGALMLSGKLLNKADRTQPLPLLRVTLTDRFGDTVGARVLTPRQYGADAKAALNAHRRFMFHVKLADPGASAVGFSLVLCEHRDHSVWCQGS